MAALTGMNVNYLSRARRHPLTGGYSNAEATNTTTAGGYDIELTYNPLPNWTMKLTGGRQAAQLSAVDTAGEGLPGGADADLDDGVRACAYSGVYTNWDGGGVDGDHLPRQLLEFVRHTTATLNDTADPTADRPPSATTTTASWPSRSRLRRRRRAPMFRRRPPTRSTTSRITRSSTGRSRASASAAACGG